MRNRNRNKSHQNHRGSSWGQDHNMNYGQEPSSYDANYGSSRWGSGRRDQYDATQFRDSSYGSSSYGANRSEYPYDRESMTSGYDRDNTSAYPRGFAGGQQGRPSNYSEGGHGTERYGRSARRGNFYNDEFDHDYENHPRRAQKEDRWTGDEGLDRSYDRQGRFASSNERARMDRQNMSHSSYGQGWDRSNNYRDFQDRDQARHQGRGYAQRADRDTERYESDSSRRNFQPYSGSVEHMQDDWSSQDRYRSRVREDDPFYYGSE